MKKQILSLLLAAISYLGIHNGHLAIFEDGKPLAVLPYRAEVYSQEDQDALRQGIPFENEKELCALLEDFLS